MLAQDNQQVTSSWFCGILEGEGSFDDIKNRKRVRICNTDEDIIEACEDYLKRNFIWYTTFKSVRKGKKDTYDISISSGKKDILFDYPQMLFNLIDNDLECRRSEFEQLLGTSTTTRGPSVNLDWLIGIYEAEGSFSSVLNCRGLITHKIELPNTNELILKKVILNLKAIGCTYYIETKKKYQEHHTQSYSISIYGMKRSLSFLQATNGKWVSWRKAKLASLMQEFAESRFSMPHKTPYTEEQLQIVRTMKDLNR